MAVVYLNGEYLPSEEAKISPDDRGFLFADGIYEATPAYGGKCFLLERHLARLANGLKQLAIDFDGYSLRDMHPQLIERNNLASETAIMVYIQVTRGVAPRGHAFPTTPITPTVYMFAKPFSRPSTERWERGYSAITVADRRWANVDIKTVSLLPNVLAQQRAVEAQCDDVVFLRDGMVMEGSHNNIFAVFGETLVTAPASNYILHGITREYVIEMAEELGLTVQERALPVEEFMRADEVFYTGTTTEIRPTIVVDGHQIGDGKVGTITRRLSTEFITRTENLRGKNI
ncbi:MAG: D-amino acid aminotransferase [Gammaproteobacteria bacterium]|nr:D-amino acid aminotransferase [Gammaproteobacteria bacterium]